MSVNNQSLPENVDDQKQEIIRDNRDNMQDGQQFQLQTNSRIIVKSIIFRLVALVITFSITYFYTTNLRKSLKVAIFIEFIQFISYFIYENAWNNVKWGYIINNPV